MSKQNFQFNYWNSNIDSKNLSNAFDEKKFDFELEKEFYMTPEQDFAYKKMHPVKGKKVLEIGCGIGINALILDEKGADVTVIDISPERLKAFRIIADKHNKDNRIKIIQASAEELPFSDGYFDIVYTKSVLIHTKLKKAASEIKRVMKKNSIGVFVEPMDRNPFVLLYRQFFAPKEWKHITNYFNDRRFERMGNIFSVYGGKEFFIFSFLAFYWQFQSPNLKKFKKYLDILNSVDSWLMKTFPFLRKYSWFKVFWVRKS